MAYGFKAEGASYGGGVAATAEITENQGTLTAALGDTIIHNCLWDNASAESITGVADGLGNVYTKLGTFFSSFLAVNYETWICRNVTVAGAAVPAATLPGTRTNRNSLSLVISGLSTSAALSSAHEELLNSATTDADVGSSLTPSAQPAILLAIGMNGYGTLALGTGFTQAPGYTGAMYTSGTGQVVEHKRLTSTSAVAALFTSDGSAGRFPTMSVIIPESGAGGGGIRKNRTFKGLLVGGRI